MFETDKLIAQQQDFRLWEGIQQFARFPDWFVSVRDSHRLAEALSAAVPEFRPGLRPGHWQLKDCGVSHIRYQNGSLSALYKLTVRKPGEAADTIIDLQGKIFPPGKYANESVHVEGILGTSQWHAVLPVLDLELEPREQDLPLAALGFLTDPEKSREFLEENLRLHYPDITIIASSPEVVRYNLGNRCTVLYHLAYDPQTNRNPEWPQIVVAKTYHGNAGKNAFDSMTALSDSPLGSSRIVKIAKPLAYQPENRVLIQGPIREEKTLEVLLGAVVKYQSPELIQEFDHYMRLTAQGLAALHASGVRLGRVWSWKDQMERVQRHVDHLAVALPELRQAASPFLERINQLAAQTPPDPLVPTHGTFRTPQVLLWKGEIGFIDFDSFRQSEPADDLALFLGEIFNFGLTPQDEDRKTRKPLDKHIIAERFDFLLAVHDHFLAEYQRHHPVSYQRVILWEALDMFMFILHDWMKIKSGDLDSTVDLLQRFLQSVFR